MAPVVLADANVLYKAVLRDLLMEIAVRRADAIQAEWSRALLKNRPDLTAAQLQRTQDLMAAALPDGCVAAYEHLIDGLSLPPGMSWQPR